ncbi:protein MOR1-like [Rhododendron vialii]|uniref:protein MOR1-like n=1 Tax=Rhododendron vialii TaxID=182163 RepID=UPI00266057EB|nr:protein MOR1-like [Rhododendron vialii]
MAIGAPRRQRYVPALGTRRKVNPRLMQEYDQVFILALTKSKDATEKAIKNKEDTSVVRVVDMTCEALRRFGAMKVPPKRILKMLAGLFDHEDANVHVSTKDLTLELCNRIEIERLKSRISEEDKVPQQEAAYEVEGSNSKESAADAPLESDDPVDILAPLKNTRFWDGVKAAEWSERKAAVAELTKLALTKRIAPGDFTGICQALKELITDVNVAVSVEAIQAIGNLAGA